MYWCVWCRFKTFCTGNELNSQLPTSVVLLLNFLTSLYQLGYQPSTIASNVSAIAFIHNILGHPDPTSAILVLNGSAADMRLPITTNILHKIISAKPTVVMLSSHRSLLRAIVCFVLMHF